MARFETDFLNSREYCNRDAKTGQGDSAQTEARSLLGRSAADFVDCVQNDTILRSSPSAKNASHCHRAKRKA